VDAWHNRPLPPCYVVLFVDAVHLSVCRKGTYNKVAVYVIFQRELILTYGERFTKYFQN
ncbi:MAG: hypothetical protein ACI94Y_000505, partial [Maribacter sp.]